MALDAVGARTEGDVFQGLFFWREAASLLIEGSSVVRVDLEHDDADGVDDVAVFYSAPGCEAGGFHSTADFYQLKYHVDQRDEYTAEAVIDPGFIGARQSLLERFQSAYQRIRTEHTGFRLHLASNWRWGADPLGPALREYDGALPEIFFDAGKGSRIGKIRESWRKHLGLDSDEFIAFARTLRFQTDHFGRRQFREGVHDRLACAGLNRPPDTHAASPYESLIQRFLMDRRASFGRDSFKKLCADEGLLDKGNIEPRRSRTVGVRSFLRFAENLDEEAATVVSVVDQFWGRHPTSARSWPQATTTIRSALAAPAVQKGLREQEHEVMLECHGSLALLTGYELSRNSGVLVYPVQKPGRALWKPVSQYTSDLWKRDEVRLDPCASDVVVALSVTHDVRKDVDAFIASSKLPAVARIDFHPAKGVGFASVEGADHAAALAADLVEQLAKARPARTSVVHLFWAAPNALLFFLGQHREALGRLKLYEFDFGLDRDGSYAASLALPVGTSEN